jgi:hypothetical protein
MKLKGRSNTIYDLPNTEIFDGVLYLKYERLLGVIDVIKLRLLEEDTKGIQYEKLYVDFPGFEDEEAEKLFSQYGFQRISKLDNPLKFCKRESKL